MEIIEGIKCYVFEDKNEIDIKDLEIGEYFVYNLLDTKAIKLYMIGLKVSDIYIIPVGRTYKSKSNAINQIKIFKGQKYLEEKKSLEKEFLKDQANLEIYPD